MPHDLTAEQQLLHDATQRLVRTVDGLHDDDWPRPSGLPGWTRAHVVAHLALNAEGLTGALTGIVQGAPVPMYASQEDRDGDIEKLAEVETAALRSRLLGGVTEFADAVAAMPPDAWDASIERTPGGPTFRAAATVGMRLREVEIHHADLAAGYAHADWPIAFSAVLLTAMTKRPIGPVSFRVDPTDLDGTWTFGEGGPTVSGTAADLGWWLTGRGDGSGLTSDDGALPGIEGW